MNGLNFVRTMNGLACTLGLPNRIDIAPAGADLDALDLVAPIRTTQLDKVAQWQNRAV